MPRRPDRFWHPAQRSIRRAHALASGYAHALRDRSRDGVVRLDDVRRRLEHYARALYDLPIRIDATNDAPRDANWSRRARRRFGLLQVESTSESDGLLIRLPARLGNEASGVSALDRYRVLTLLHAERIHRQSGAQLARTDSTLERDLFLLAETAEAHRSLALSTPGMRPLVDKARLSALAHRTMPDTLTSLERRVEEMLRSALGVQTVQPDAGITAQVSAAAALEWARETAAALASEFRMDPARYYRGLAPITLWGTSLATRPALVSFEGGRAEMRQADAGNAPAEPQREATRQMTPSPSSTPDAQAAAEEGSDALRSAASPDAPPESSVLSAQQQDDADAPPAGVDEGTGALGGSNTAALRQREPGAREYRYPEWDCNADTFHRDGTIVRVVRAKSASSEWADAALRDHMVLVRQARQQFERLQSHPRRLARQEQGDELDLDACVRALVDRRMGVTPDDQFYSTVRPGRRELAITLLLDISQSTRDVVFETQRVIDLERLAALVAAAALDALGDEYSILAFSSDGAADVRVSAVKDFSEPNADAVRQRLSSLVPDGKTRLGAAIRHASAQLERHHASHRLLLILSDGKPNDRDAYFLDYGVEDSRRAVLDARAAGVHPFCITVDRERAADYMGDIFGASGYLTVQKPVQLPRALLGAVQRLLIG